MYCREVIIGDKDVFKIRTYRWVAHLLLPTLRKVLGINVWFILEGEEKDMLRQ